MTFFDAQRCREYFDISPSVWDRLSQLAKTALYEFMPRELEEK